MILEKKNNYKKIFICICITLLPYIYFLRKIVLKSKYILGHDAFLFHFKNFAYLVNSLKHGFGIPTWYANDGGVPLGMYTLNYGLLMPYKWIGYAIYLYSNLEPMKVYKITLVLGMICVAIGFWLLLYKLTKSIPSTIFGTWMLLLGGFGLTVFHQEQIIFTIFYVPWVLLAFFKTLEDIKWIYVLSILYGFSLTAHFPPIIFISTIFMIISMFIFHRSKVLFYWKKILIKKNIKHFIIASILFILSITPSLYTFKNLQNYRGNVLDGVNERLLATKTLKDYMKLNSGGTSAPIKYFKQYVMKSDVPDDRFGFFVTRTGLVIALAISLFGFRKVKLYLLLLCLFSIATMGRFSFFAHFLYIIRFPTISIFREYYHFFPFINIVLAIIGAIGMRYLLLLIDKFYKQKMKLNFFNKKNITMMVIFTIFILESHCYFFSYLSKYTYNSKKTYNNTPNTKYAYSGTLTLVENPPTFNLIHDPLRRLTKDDFLRGLNDSFKGKNELYSWSNLSKGGLLKRKNINYEIFSGLENKDFQILPNGINIKTPKLEFRKFNDIEYRIILYINCILYILIIILSIFFLKSNKNIKMAILKTELDY